MYRVYFQEFGKKLVHNGMYEKKKEALHFYVNFKKENDVKQIFVVEIDENEKENVLISFEK
jgi:hypothetical protein